jgi:tetratricopeptide (TPR) repeat protein
VAYLKLGKIDRALADFDAALRLQPKDAHPLHGRGLARLRKGNRAGAEADFAAAKRLRLDIAQAYAVYGVATPTMVAAPAAAAVPAAIATPATAAAPAQPQKFQPASAPAAAAAAAVCAHAETHWKSAEEIKTMAVYQDHLARFPDCAFSVLAKARIEAMRK